MECLDLGAIRGMSSKEWFNWLHDKYFPWKYTAHNRLATTRGSLRRSVDKYGLQELFEIKESILNADHRSIGACLSIARRIPGLGVAGASGLLAVLFPGDFGTVDQFVVYALRDISDLPEKDRVRAMRPESLSQTDAICLMEIFGRQAKALNRRFRTSCWTPRKVDKVLWTVGHDAESRAGDKKGAPASRQSTSRSSGRKVTIEDHISRGEPHIQDLFKKLRSDILAIDPTIVEKAHSNIDYAANGRNFVEMWIQKRRLDILLRPREYHDPRGMISKVPETHGWTLDRRLYLSVMADLDYVLELIRASYSDVV